MNHADDPAPSKAPGTGRALGHSDEQQETGSTVTIGSNLSGSQDSAGGRRRAFDSIHGQTIDRYTVMETLGEGAMGAVYAAYDPDLDRRVAIKLLRARHSKKHRKRLEREARALARLSHPNVVQVHDVGLYMGDVFVTMELVDGQSLRDWSRRTPKPSWREVLDAYLDAARGIAAMHEKGLIHRDIKPANVLIGYDGRVRIADFGLAAASNRASDSSAGDTSGGRSSGGDSSGDSPMARDTAVDHLSSPSPASSLSLSHSGSELEGRVEDRLTRTGTLLGTPAFMAPEQHSVGDVGPAADQYSLCASIYEGVYGLLPFKASPRARRGEELAGLLKRKYEGQFTDPPAGSKVPQWVRQVLLRGMAADPDDRYPTMNDLIAAFEITPKNRRRLLLLGGGTGGVAVVAAAVTALVLLRSEAPLPHLCQQFEDGLAELSDEELATHIRSGTPILPGSQAEILATWSPCGPIDREQPDAPCSLAIDAPQTGTHVKTVVTVQGTAKLPPNTHLWTFITVVGKLFQGRWWPQQEASVHPTLHSWKTFVHIGSAQDVGKEFELAAVLVNHYAHLQLLRYQCEAFKSGKWKPLPMPHGTVWGPRSIRVQKVGHEDPSQQVGQ